MNRSKENPNPSFLQKAFCVQNLCTAYWNSWMLSNKYASKSEFVKMWENGRTLSFFKIDYLTEINPN